MQKLHLVLGLAVVLVLSLAIPALGGPLGSFSANSKGAGSIARWKSIAKKAQKAATTAQQLAVAAQSAATTVQGAADTAQRTASAAQSAANGAQSAASSAQGSAAAAKTVATSAQSAATEAQGRVNSVETTAQQAMTSANSALTTVAKKFGKVEEVKVLAPSPNPNNHEAEATAHCPPGSEVIGGGFLIFENPAEPHLSLPIENGWFVAAQAGSDDPFRLEVIAMCLKP